MTSRHHYSIPGASFLKTRGSLKSQSQKAATTTSNVPSSTRDTRQPSSSRASYTQEAAAGSAPIRPPSASGYRTQHPNASVNGFHAPGNTRQQSAQRPTTTPPASSSRTRLDAPEHRNYFTKMFGRKQTPAPDQAEKQKSSHKHRRSSQVYPASAPVQAPYPAGPSTSRATYDASLQARDSDLDDRNRNTGKDDRVRGERTKEERERLRAEYAAYKARLEEAERAQAAGTKMNRMDRAAPRPSREEKRQQEYESDNARRRLQAPQMAQSFQKQEARQSQYLHPAPLPNTAASRATAPARNSQQTLPPQAAVRPPGVPVHPSTSSQSTPASHQGQVLHSAPQPTHTEPSSTANTFPSSTPAPHADSAPVPPPKANFTQHHIPDSQDLSHQTHTAPSAPNMLPPYLASGLDDRHRLDREAAERDALLSRERERIEKDRELTRRREVEREATEREAAARERELERRREAEKEAADQELQLHRERERERELERERRRARRAERERARELEKAEHERQKDQERAERERQKQIERTERERLKALEQQELERQKEAERLRRERKERDRAEKDRVKAEWERQQEIVQAERERLRGKAERERERATRSASKHRSHRDKSQSMPTNALLAAASGSDTDRMGNRKESRHRSQSYSAVTEAQPNVLPTSAYHPDPRMDAMLAQGLAAFHGHAAKKDTQQISSSHHDPAQIFSKPSALLPIPPSHVDVTNPRSSSTVPLSNQVQQHTPPQMPDRSRTDPLLPTELRAGMRPAMDPMLWNQPLSEGHAKLVSIYASQGPPDRSAYRATQKTNFSSAEVEQQSPAPAPIASIPHAGRPRSSLDQPSHRASIAQPNTTPPVAAPPTPQDLPQPEPAAHRVMSSHPRQPDVFASTSITPTSKPPQPDMALPVSYGKLPPSPSANFPPPAAQIAHSIEPPQSTDVRPTAVKPGTNTSYGTGFSSYSQTVLGLTKELPSVPALVQQVGSMSRAPSNNSTRSPSRKTAQLPLEASSGGFGGTPISRTASDASRSTEQGEQQQISAPRAKTHVPSSQHPVQPISATPMYSSTQNTSLTSRVRHESVTNLHQQAVFPTHSYSQSLPQPLNSSKDEVHLFRHDNVQNPRTTAPIPATADALHQQYPPFHASSSQSKAAYNPSTNASLPMQSQQPHAALSSSTQDHKPPLRVPVNSNNVSSYSAAVASLNTFSQMPSTVFSHQQSTHPPNSPMYHNPSTSRNQHHQQATNSTRPPFSLSNGSQAPPATPKPSGPFRSVNSSVHATSTRPSGPFVEDSPSSVDEVVRLDSPLVKPQLQHSLHPAEQTTPQLANNRPPSQFGPPDGTTVQGSSQAHNFAETQKPGRPQDADSPPPLTPSSSSHDSHEEILMTPASLDQARIQVDVRQPPDSSQRSEKKKGGLLRIFRSNSTKSTKEKDTRVRVEKAGSRPVEQEPRRQVPGSLHDQRAESINKPRSTRPPSIMIPAEPNSNPTNAGSSAMDQHFKQQSRAPRHVPPPIAIPPPPSIPYRLFGSKSRRYRTMSSASMEAVDGTANNTVVGSPTSSRRSPTPSGPMTPPIRDPIEAAQSWRNNADVFLDPGSHRRRRPGVTFDLKDFNEGQKDGALYRRAHHRQRRDSPR